MEHVSHGVKFSVLRRGEGKWDVVIDGGAGGRFSCMGAMSTVMARAEHECRLYAKTKAAAAAAAAAAAVVDPVADQAASG